MGSECFISMNNEYDEELEKYIQKIKENNYSNKTTTVRKRNLSTDEFDSKYSTYYSFNKNFLFNETYTFEQKVNLDSLNVIPKRSKSYTKIINYIDNN